MFLPRNFRNRNLQEFLYRRGDLVNTWYHFLTIVVFGGAMMYGTASVWTKVLMVQNDIFSMIGLFAGEINSGNFGFGNFREKNNYEV